MQKVGHIQPNDILESLKIIYRWFLILEDKNYICKYDDSFKEFEICPEEKWVHTHEPSNINTGDARNLALIFFPKPRLFNQHLEIWLILI